MSSENYVRIIMAESLRFLEEGSSAPSKSEAKVRLKSVADAQTVEIPVLPYNRTVGTRRQATSRERKARCKRAMVREAKPPEKQDT